MSNVDNPTLTDEVVDDLLVKIAEAREGLATKSADEVNDELVRIEAMTHEAEEREAMLARKNADARLSEFMRSRQERLSNTRRAPKFEYDMDQPKVASKSAKFQSLGELGHALMMGQTNERFVTGHTETVQAEDGALVSKAVTEGNSTALVPPQYMQRLIDFRRAANVFRGLVTVAPATGNSVTIPRMSAGMTAAWVGEGATKPSTDITTGSITVNLFTAAHVAKVTNQLLRTSMPSVEPLVTQELGNAVGALEEIAIIAGTGSSQPLGILGTTGINGVTLAAAPTTATYLTAILDAIYQIRTVAFTEPTAIVMHPRRWRALRQLQVGTNGAYLFGSPVDPNQVDGVPIRLSQNIPTNLGTGVNEDRIIVGDFREAWLLEENAFNIEVSSVAGTAFETNMTFYRGEERIGFTAARRPAAFSVISGAGLVP